MTQDPQHGRGTSTGPLDPGLAHRVEGLVDEAVALAAKGSYAEATLRAQEAIAIDPGNREARDLVESYRKLAASDEERRRRRRTIAGAAAAIEEMIESERLEEADTAVEALALQYGSEAPAQELRARLLEARGADLDFGELDAAIDAIRRPAVAPVTPSPPPGPTDPASTIAAEVEEQLRSGRLEDAAAIARRLEGIPGAEERLSKLQRRIEEGRHSAAENRREEEILIATAAIEERIRRGHLDDAAGRLDELAARHGAGAPVDELRARLQEARAELVGADSEPAVAIAEDDEANEQRTAGNRGRAIAIAAAIAAIVGGAGWWLYQRSAATAGAAAGEATAIVEPVRNVDATGAANDPGSAQAIESGTDAGTAPVAGATLAGAGPEGDGETAAAPAVDAVAGAPAPIERVDTERTAAAAPAAPETAPLETASSEPAATEGGADSLAQDRAEGEAGVSPASVEPDREAAVAVSVAPETVVAEPAPPPRVPAPRVAAAETAPRVEVSSAPARVAPLPAGPSLLTCGDPGVVCPRAVNVPQPPYPQLAQARRLSGSVIVNALVDETGSVIETRVEPGSSRFFEEAAEAAASRAVFQPASRDGVPGRSWARMSFKFSPR